jgi:hypothetical protein
VIEKMQKALHEIAFYDGFMDEEAARGMMEIARRTLREKT